MHRFMCLLHQYRLKLLDWFNLKKRRLRGNLTAVFSYLTEYSKYGERLFSELGDRTRQQTLVGMWEIPIRYM